MIIKRRVNLIRPTLDITLDAGKRASPDGSSSFLANGYLCFTTRDPRVSRFTTQPLTYFFFAHSRSVDGCDGSARHGALVPSTTMLMKKGYNAAVNYRTMTCPLN